MDPSSSLVEQLQLNQMTSLKIYGKQKLIELGGIEGLVILLRHNSSVTRLLLFELHIGALIIVRVFIIVYKPGATIYTPLSNYMGKC
jgi:hypothetical protein